MAIRTINHLPAVDGVRAIPGYRDCLNSYVLCDSLPEFAAHMDSQCGTTYHGLTDLRWNGGMTKAQTINAVCHGDLSGVAKADAMLATMESRLTVLSQGWESLDTVSGAIPNVPAYLSGNPMNMRTRRRTTQANAPLCIVADLVSSGSISAQGVSNRGAAILALVRVLSNVRPIELWAGVELDARDKGTNSCAAVYARIETTPLDLARAAHMLTHPSVPRGLCYAFLEKHYASNVLWAYGSTGQGVEIHRQHGGAAFARVINPSADMLFIPPIFARDQSINNPAQWLESMVRQYGGVELEAA